MKKIVAIFVFSLTFFIFLLVDQIVKKSNLHQRELSKKEINQLVDHFDIGEAMPFSSGNFIPDVAWKEYKEVREKFNERDFFSDIGNHTNENKYYLDRPTTAHEWNHGINSDIRNSVKGNFNAYYVGNDHAIWLPEPRTTLAKVSKFVPYTLQGSRFKLYLIEQQVYWNNQPLYIFDEFVAYRTSTIVAIEECKKKDIEKGGERTDEAFSCLEFSIYGLAVCMAIKQDDPTYWEQNKEFRSFVGFMFIEAMKKYREAQEFQHLRWDDEDYWTAVTSEEGKPFRDLAREITGENIFVRDEKVGFGPKLEHKTKQLFQSFYYKYPGYRREVGKSSNE